MTGIESLNCIKDKKTVDNIKEMTKCFVSHVKPLKVILFGSFAGGNYTEESDYDFYLVIDDNRSVGEATDAAYNSVTYVKKRPVDIVVGTNSGFETKKNLTHSLMVEREVQKNGILLYDKNDVRGESA